MSAGGVSPRLISVLCAATLCVLWGTTAHARGVGQNGDARRIDRIAGSGGGEAAGAESGDGEEGAGAGQGAQGEAMRRGDDGLSLSLAIGWSGALVPGRWCPIEVTVASEKEAFEGVVTAEYVQDVTQEAAIAVPVTAVPGRSGVATVWVNLPAHTENVEITLVSAATGRRVRNVVCAAYPSDDQIRLPPVLPEVRFLWGLLADRDSAAGSIDRLYGSASDGPVVRGVADKPGFPERNAACLAGIRVAQAPAVWAGYDAFDGVVAQDEEIGKLDARAQRALRQWVRSGGRLVVLVTTPAGAGTLWRALGVGGSAVGGGESAVPVEIGEAREDAVPGALRAAVDAQVQQLRTAEAEAESGIEVGDTQRRGVLEGDVRARVAWEVPGVAASMRAARIRLTAAGEAGAWRLVFASLDEVGEAGNRDDVSSIDGDRKTGEDGNAKGGAGVGNGEGGGGMGVGEGGWAWIAEGPIEFGMVTLVTFDPRRIGERADVRLTACAWRSVLGEDAQDMARQASASAGQSWGYRMTDRGRVGVAAASAALDALCGAPRLSAMIPLGIGASVAAMALVLGLIDPNMLGRARRPWSFLTALAWIGGAGVISWLVPEALRGSGSSVATLRVVDVGPSGNGAAGGIWGAGEEPGIGMGFESAGWGYRSRLTSIWAGAGGEAPLAKDDPGAWYRGVSSQEAYVNEQRVPGRASFVQRAGDFSGEEAGAESGGAWALGGATLPARVGVAVWTLRSFLDLGREAAGISAELTPAAGTALLTVRGIGANEEIVAAGVQVKDGWYIAEDFARHGAQSVGSAQEASAPGEPHLEARLQWSGESPSVALDRGQRVSTADPEPRVRLRRVGPIAPVDACRLPGAWERGRAVDVLRESGRFAVVIVMTESLGGDGSSGGGGRGEGAAVKETRVYRLVVPIDEAFVEIGRRWARERGGGPSEGESTENPEPASETDDAGATTESDAEGQQ